MSTPTTATSATKPTSDSKVATNSKKFDFIEQKKLFVRFGFMKQWFEKKVRRCSGIFMVGGVDWRISLTNDKDDVSCYLCLMSPRRVCCSYRVFISTSMVSLWLVSLAACQKLLSS